MFKPRKNERNRGGRVIDFIGVTQEMTKRSQVQTKQAGWGGGGERERCKERFIDGDRFANKTTTQQDKNLFFLLFQNFDRSYNAAERWFCKGRKIVKDLWRTVSFLKRKRTEKKSFILKVESLGDRLWLQSIDSCSPLRYRHTNVHQYLLTNGQH